MWTSHTASRPDKQADPHAPDLAEPPIKVRLLREPVYQQLTQALRALLSSPEFPIGARFLTERQISGRFRVSRATANKALSNLVSEGLLEFHKGVGTFVRGRKMDYNLRALEKRYVAAAHCPELNENDASGSLYAVWTRKYNLNLVGADQTIRAVSLHGADARQLEVREGAAGMLVSSTGYLAGGAPLWFERTLYRGDAYELHNRLGGLQTPEFASGRFLARAHHHREES